MSTVSPTTDNHDLWLSVLLEFIHSSNTYTYDKLQAMLADTPANKPMKESLELLRDKMWDGVPVEWESYIIRELTGR